MKHLQRFLGVETIAFAAASLVHAGILIDGYQHRQAEIAEGVIAGVLMLGLAVSLVRPRASRAAALGAQGFALLGTLVGITMISIGVGPQSAFDVALHVCFVTLLVAGLVAAARSRPSNGLTPGASMGAPRGAMS
jgi:hypothetical protein